MSENKDMVQVAREFAIERHGNQMYGIHPYLYHLERVRQTLIRFGHKSQEMQVAALLHDVIEDTATSYNDVRNVFGHQVAELVYAVTDELGRNRAERHKKTYPKTKALGGAVTLKLADRIANVEYALEVKDEKMLALYRKEHTEFTAALSGPLDDQQMWAHLHTLLA